ncbi:MAG TPA: MBL fold metallo-hydrolase [Thermodesulfobacteriota bacterium]|nr:MBL fold metallo-hydrolase [Thermodesulfobacteriota bacterium]
MKQITPNVYVETEFIGSNVSFVTTRAGVIMVDSPMIPTDALRWRGEILDRGAIRYLINTEHHPDHVAGNFFFPGTVLSSEKTRREILGLPLEEFRKRIALDPDGHGLYLFDHCHYRIKAPDLAYSGTLSLFSGDHTFELHQMPGHTLGQSAVYIPQEKVLITGDTVTYKNQIFLHDSEPFLWLESLKRITDMEIDLIVPGHGEVCDKRAIQELSTFIQEWIDAVKGAIRRGMSKEEAMEKISFLDRYPMPSVLQSWGPDLQRWNVGRLYHLLTPK